MTQVLLPSKATASALWSPLTSASCVALANAAAPSVPEKLTPDHCVAAAKPEPVDSMTDVVLPLNATASALPSPFTSASWVEYASCVPTKLAAVHCVGAP